MKLFSVLFLVMNIVALSGEANAAPTLKENMKSIGGIVKTMVKELPASTNPGSFVANAHQLVVLFTAVKEQIPDTILALPASDQEAAMADYKRLVQLELDGATSLEAALSANSKDDAMKILVQMNGTKKEGHDKFEKKQGQ